MIEQFKRIEKDIYNISLKQVPATRNWINNFGALYDYPEEWNYLRIFLEVKRKQLVQCIGKPF